MSIENIEKNSEFIEEVIVDEAAHSSMPVLKRETPNQEQLSKTQSLKNIQDKKNKEHKFAPNKEEIQRRRCSLALNILCKLTGVALIIGMFAVFGLTGLFGWHTTAQMTEHNFLRSQGYFSLYPAADYKLNIYRIGNSLSNGPTIVCLSGMGIHDYSVAMSPVHDELKDDMQFVYIDRAGYGMSEDTRETQTVEKIVSDYRAALINANLKPPYVLMPHSIGGVYATYWQSMYPDEIAGVIYLDGTPVTPDAIEEENIVTIHDKNLVELYQIGICRLVLNDYLQKLPDSYTTTQKEVSQFIQTNSIATFAQLSELEQRNNNIMTAYDSLVKNDIPKAYICSYVGYQTKEEVKEYFEWPYNQSVSVEYTDERAERLLEQARDARETLIMPYVEKLGNTELIYLPGDHLIYLQKPIELANIIRDCVIKWNLLPAQVEEVIDKSEDAIDMSNVQEVETVSFGDYAINADNLCDDTLGWLEWYNSIPEEEQMSIDYVPADLLDACGLTLEDVIGTTEETEPIEEEVEEYFEEDYEEEEYFEETDWEEPSYG